MVLDLTERPFTIDDNVIQITSDTRIERYRVPKGRDRISVEYRPKNRAVLTVGSLKTMTVQVVGPREDIMRLLEAIR